MTSQAQTIIRDYYTGEVITGPAADAKRASIARILASEPQETEAQRNAVAFRVNVLKGIYRPLRG